MTKTFDVDDHKVTSGTEDVRVISEKDLEDGQPIKYKDASEESEMFPSATDLFFDFNGSIGFVVGSSGFIFALYEENWLAYFRYGCIIWIWGCIFYSIPIIAQFHDYTANASAPFPGILGDIGALVCYACFIVGCILGGFYAEEDVIGYFMAINWLFVVGSLALTMEPFTQAYIFLFVRKGSAYKRMTYSPLCGTGEGLGLSIDRVLELLAIISFCTAGSFGGFGPNFTAVKAGNYCWEVGSVFCFFLSLLKLYRRLKGLGSSDQSWPRVAT